jgi:hypothetical protein
MLDIESDSFGQLQNISFVLGLDIQVPIRWYWMIYREPSIVWFGSSPTPSPSPSPVSNLSLFSVFLCVAGRAYGREREAGRWWRSQIIRRWESLASITHSMFSCTHLSICWFIWNIFSGDITSGKRHNRERCTNSMCSNVAVMKELGKLIHFHLSFYFI